MVEFNDRRFDADGEPIRGGSKKFPKNGKNRRSDDAKASLRARKALRTHQTAQHLGGKNEFGQRVIDTAQTAKCATCTKLQAAVDATRPSK